MNDTLPLKLERATHPVDVDGRRLPLPCEREAALIVTTVAARGYHRYAFLINGQRVLGQMGTDAWPKSIDNVPKAHFYGLQAALRSLTDAERHKITDQGQNDGKGTLLVLSTHEWTVRLLQSFAEEPHSIDDHIPPWLLSRIDKLVKELGLKLKAVMVDNHSPKVCRTYSFMARVAENQTEKHPLPTAYGSLDLRLVDTEEFNRRKRERETASVPATPETAVTA